MKKLNAKGFAHHVAIMAVIVVVAIGGIGSYVFLKGSSAYTATGVCGSGYSQRKSAAVSGGTVYLTINPSAKTACAVLMATSGNYGVKKFRSVKLQLVNTHSTVLKTSTTSQGDFSYYAGPVRLGYGAQIGQKSTVMFKVITKVGTQPGTAAWMMNDVGTLTTSNTIPTAFSDFNSMNYSDDGVNYGTQQCKVRVSNLVAGQKATVTFYFKPSASLLRLAKDYAEFRNYPSSKLFTARMEAYPTSGGSVWLQNPSASGSSQVYHSFGSLKTSDGYYTRSMQLYVPVKAGVKFKKFIARYSGNHSDSSWMQCNVTRLP